MNFIHVANVFYLLSYLVKDILWLRVLAVLGGSILVVYYATFPTPLWAPIGWDAVFLTTNLVQIGILIRERRPVRLEPAEMRLYEHTFRSLTPHEFVKVLRLARWESIDAGKLLVRGGEELDRIMVLASGRVRIEQNGAPIRELMAGCFVGDMSFLTGATPNVDVVTVEPVRTVSWSQRELHALLLRNAELRAAFQTILSEDLIAKLRSA
ncbi:Cyclic nucleotide-binding domain protein [Labilithrix luteola]|uniref:Cyclic nucleotide-binding domain protein n=1 Tax=Labilithrix luteola TaxID=1391654 RepID=A0A0K1Q2S3_9BACT|nr:cyclic nucleotide-binding domain-containing protein [Labilithrix luteola]AKV00069.1 Cyclic nucleotide-binding domain protein [Labilithrix luteola]